MTSQLSPASPSLWSLVGVIRSLLAARCIATSRHVTTAPSSPVPSRDVDANYIFLFYFLLFYFFAALIKSSSLFRAFMKTLCVARRSKEGLVRSSLVDVFNREHEMKRKRDIFFCFSSRPFLPRLP